MADVQLPPHYDPNLWRRLDLPADIDKVDAVFGILTHHRGNAYYLGLVVAKGGKYPWYQVCLDVPRAFLSDDWRDLVPEHKDALMAELFKAVREIPDEPPGDWFYADRH